MCGNVLRSLFGGGGKDISKKLFIYILSAQTYKDKYFRAPACSLFPQLVCNFLQHFNLFRIFTDTIIGLIIAANNLALLIQP